MEHELDYAGGQGFLGSIDANTGDLLLGWDTDQFPTDIYLTTKACSPSSSMAACRAVNFDAKVRREGHEPIDLFHAHRRQGRLCPWPEDRRRHPCRRAP